MMNMKARVGNLKGLEFVGHLQITTYVMDRTKARQGKKTWLQPRGEIQDKTR